MKLLLQRQICFKKILNISQKFLTLLGQIINSYISWELFSRGYHKLAVWSFDPKFTALGFLLLQRYTTTMVIPTKEKYLIWWLTFLEFYSIITMV